MIKHLKLVVVCSLVGYTLSNAATPIVVAGHRHHWTQPALSNLGARQGEEMPENALVKTVIVDHQSVHLVWHHLGKSVNNGWIQDTFRSSPVQIIATAKRSLSSGDNPIEYSLTLVNLSPQSVSIPTQPTLAYSMATGPDSQIYWVEKPAGKPSPVGFHCDRVKPGIERKILSEPYFSDKRAYSTDWKQRDAVPWLAIYNSPRKSGSYFGIESTGRVSIDLVSSPNRTHLEAGIDGDPKLQTRLDSGKSVQFPTVFVGKFHGDIEDGCNELTQWVVKHLEAPVSDSRYPLLNFDSWGSDMGINEPSCEAMLKTCAELGIEQFQIDAGWYRSVGDWQSDPKKFPNGVVKISNDAHRLGLKFGLWVAWTQGGIDDPSDNPGRILSVQDPKRRDWFADNYPTSWKPASYTGANLCLASPEAQKWCIDLLDGLIRENHMDMLEHDQQMVVEDCVQTNHPHSTSQGDIANRSAQGYYRVYDEIHRRFPNLMFENCVNGGRNIDFGAAKRASYFSIVDSYDPLSNRQAIFDVTHVLPASMCECYVMAMPVKTIPEFRSMLRSGLMGWFSLMQDPTKWTTAQQSAAKEEFSNYKSHLRALVLSGNVYHVSDRPNGVHWDGMEYFARDRSKGVLFAFRGSVGDKSHRYRLKGLDAKSEYLVSFHDGGQNTLVTTGANLMTQGVIVKLDDPGTSQLVWIEKAKSSRR